MHLTRTQQRRSSLALAKDERLTTTERYGTSNRGCENRTTVRFNGESAHSDKV